MSVLSTWCNQSSITGANFDRFLKARPYFIKINGTGTRAALTAPRIDMAGPTPSVWNIGLEAIGKPAAMILRRKVFAAVALAA